MGRLGNWRYLSGEALSTPNGVNTKVQREGKSPNGVNTKVQREGKYKSATGQNPHRFAPKTHIPQLAFWACGLVLQILSGQASRLKSLIFQGAGCQQGFMNLNFQLCLYFGMPETKVRDSLPSKAMALLSEHECNTHATLRADFTNLCETCGTRLACEGYGGHGTKNRRNKGGRFEAHTHSPRRSSA